MRFVLAMVLACWAALPAAGQDYPARPVRIVLPFSAGGGTDVMTRIIAERLQGRIGGRVLVENVTGAGGNIGTERVARAEPDGHTLLLATMSLVSINPALYRDLPFDVERDFAPISLLLETGHLIVAGPGIPVRSLAELEAAAKAAPRGIGFASAGAGTSTHLYGELFRYLTGADILHVPYRGNGPALADVIAGHVGVMFDQAPNSADHVRAGRVRALAVTTPARLPFAPDVPTAAEAGYPGLMGTSWAGVMAPRATPPAVVARLHAAFQEVLAETETRTRLDGLGATARGSSPEALGALAREELAKWTRVIQAAGLSAR